MVHRNYILDRLKSRSTTIDEFNFDKLQAPPILSIMTPEDIQSLYTIVHSIKYSAQPQLKYKLIDQIMQRRGFRKLSAGTNRLCYAFIEDNSFVAKVAYDDIARGDNLAEFQNQFILKPFVTKIFETTPCGTLAFAERVKPITNREEYITVSDDVYNLITEFLIGEYVLADIGSKFFMNYGLRTSFGVVLLDFPYMYKVDRKKLYCNKPDPMSPTGCCDGEIDYDDGFNFLVCTKCGARYKAKELELQIKNSNIIIKEKGGIKMKVRVSGGSLGGEEKIIEVGNTTPTPNISVTVTAGKPMKKGPKGSNSTPKAVNGVPERTVPMPPAPQEERIYDAITPEQIAELNDKLTNWKAKFEDIQARYDQLKALKEEADEKVQVMQATVNNAEEKVAGLLVEIDALKNSNADLAEQLKNIEEEEESNDFVTFHSDESIAGALETIQDYLDKVIELSGILTDDEKIIVLTKLKETELQVTPINMPKVEAEEEVVEEKVVDVEVPMSAEELIGKAVDKIMMMPIQDKCYVLEHENALRLVQMYEPAVSVVNDNGIIRAEVQVAVKDEESDRFDTIASLGTYARFVETDIEGVDDCHYFFTDDEYKKEVDDRIEALVDELEDMKAKLNDNAPEVQEEIATEEEAVEETTVEEENKYSDTPIYLHGVTKDLKDIYPEMESKKVILLEDETGEYVTGGNNALIAIDKLDNQSLEDVTTVSTSWFENVEELFNNEDEKNWEEANAEQEAESEMPEVGVNGVK